ncbi:MAG: ankyrin repeat domain-containing protein [Candidatus Dependentiae bacterium]|nr:ankyrin repeat domain-containing protein [Candidatus Dependentiae bacterium]
MKKIFLSLCILSNSMQIFCSYEKVLTLQELAFEALKPKIKLSINKGTDLEEIEMIKDVVPDLFSNFINHHRLYNDGTTFLEYAIRFNDPAKVQLLLHYGADVNQRNIDGRTPLHCAAYHNADKAIPLLITAKGDIMIKSYAGETPLHLAAENDCLRAIELLIAAGADITIQNKFGETAREFIKPDYITRMIFDRAVIKSEKYLATKIQALTRGFLARKNLKSEEK